MGAGHDHGGADARVSRMLIAAGILSVFFVIELTTALLINSIALLADAGHMLTDLVAMFMGLTAVLLARHGSASAKTDVRLAPRRGVHRRRQRRAAAVRRGLHPVRGGQAVRRRTRHPRRPDDRRRTRRPDRQRRCRAAAAFALRGQPRRQGRLHGGRRRHRRQHRRADRGHRHGHDALALRRRRRRRPCRTVGASARDRARAGGVAHPVRVLALATSTSRSYALRCADSTASPKCTTCTSGRWCRARTWPPRT